MSGAGETLRVKNHETSVEPLSGDSTHAHWRNYSESVCLTVSCGGDRVASATLIYDEQLSHHHGPPVVFISSFEAKPDAVAVAALTSQIKAWAQERGAVRVRGPMTPFIGDERGILISGFEYGPCIGFPFSPPYYQEMLQQNGFIPAMDMFAYQFTLAESVWYQRVARFAGARLKNVKVQSLADMDKTDAFNRVARIYNEAWQASWMFFPVEPADLRLLYDSLRDILIPELNFIISIDGADAGVFMSAPNVLNVDEKGMARSYRGMLFGVMPEYRKRGVDAMLASTAFERATALGYTLFDIGWILESNSSWLRQAAKFAGGGSRKRIFRVYDLVI
jgi:GNAT superfamily N-acetyltransferase